MKLKTYLLALTMGLSVFSFGQAFSMSGSYSPTFESFNFGLGMASNDFLMDYQFGIGDEFFSMGMDLQFGLTGDMLLRSHDLSVFYLGVGGEMLLMDDYEKDMGYALYGMASISYNLFVFSYGYGIYEYDGIPAGDLEDFHKFKITIIFGEIIND